MPPRVHMFVSCVFYLSESTPTSLLNLPDFLQTMDSTTPSLFQAETRAVTKDNLTQTTPFIRTSMFCSFTFYSHASIPKTEYYQFQTCLNPPRGDEVAIESVRKSRILGRGCFCSDPAARGRAQSPWEQEARRWVRTKHSPTVKGALQPLPNRCICFLTTLPTQVSWNSVGP